MLNQTNRNNKAQVKLKRNTAVYTVKGFFLTMALLCPLPSVFLFVSYTAPSRVTQTYKVLHRFGEIEGCLRMANK